MLIILTAALSLFAWGSSGAAGGSEGWAPPAPSIVMTIEYGTQPGQLDTSRVGRDDPDQTLVQSYRVDEAHVWIMPPVGISRRQLFCYGSDGAFQEAIPHDGGSHDFLVTPQGIYSSAFGSRSGEYGRLFLSAKGKPLQRVVWPKTDRTKLQPGNLGRFQELADGIYVVAFGCTFSIRLGSDGLLASITGDDIIEGVPTSAGRIWQNTLFIMRDLDPILDLGLEGGGLVAVFPDGGFVIRRKGLSIGGDWHDLFERYDPSGKLLRATLVHSPRGKYGVGLGRFFFTPDAVYQMVLDESEGRLLKY